ncbi:AMP-binding protein [Haloarchaeobius amylolyticus]|uniref:AMP-binding protein n=1 Tax=Haloarchaeobius amylolyticus TaxID=1198296 RepID=A0ABD6BD47_9EURY
MDATAPPETLRTVKSAVEMKAARNEDEILLHCQNRAVSYAELDRNANAIANNLRAQGIEKGDVVCLFMYNCPEYISLFFALAKIGAVAAPIDTRFRDETLAYALSQSDATTIFIDAKTRPEYESVTASVPNITREYLVDETATDHPYRAFSTLLEGDSTSTPSTTVEPSDPVAVIYVQRNATERPKGVVLPHYSYINTGWEACENLFDFTEDDRIFTTLPLYSIFTFQIGIIGTLLADAVFILAGQFDPSQFWDQIESYDATVFLYLSRMLSVLHNQDERPTNSETPAEMAIGHSFGFTTDEAMFRTLEERFDITILEGYGVTPATIATYNRPDDRRLGSVGKEASYVELEIVDGDDWPVPPGETGEIVVRPTEPHTMMQGYYGQPEATTEAFRNQWLHTGGIGYKDEDGYLHFVANRDNSIYRGRIDGRISSLEIESVIDAQPGVRQSSVVGVTNEGGSEEIKAFVVPEEDADITPIDICRRCERQLPYLKVPRYIEIRDEFPRSPSGKIRKQDLKAEGTVDAWDRKSGYELSR